MDGYLSKQTIQFVREILSSPERRQQMVETNYALASRHYAYSRLRQRLNVMLGVLFGEGAVTLEEGASDSQLDGYLTIDPAQVAFKRFTSRHCQRGTRG